MVAFNFEARFAPAIERNEKTITIRKQGLRRRPRIGEELQLYTGQRTKACRLLRLAICSSVVDISIKRRNPITCDVKLDGAYLSRHQLEDLIRADGFATGPEFFNYHGDDFDGYVVGWRNEE